MNLLRSTIHGRGELFAPTQWSVVLAAAQADQEPEAAAAALGALCQTYWAPLYTFVRSRNYGPHDAQDLTQGFFAHLIEHRISEGIDPSKGKFRSYLLASLKNYLADARAREQTCKRGGGHQFVPLHETLVVTAEACFQSHHDEQCLAAHDDRAYELSWAQAVVDAAMERVSEAYFAENKADLFVALKPFITGDTNFLPAYDDLASTLGIPASTLRSHVTRLRARYRESLRAEVRRTVSSAQEVEDELRELIRVLIGR